MRELANTNATRVANRLPPLRMYLTNMDLLPHEGNGFAYEFATTDRPDKLYVWVNARHPKGASALIQRLQQQASIVLGEVDYSIVKCSFLRRYRRGYLNVVQVNI